MPIPYFYKEETKRFNLIYDALWRNVSHRATYGWAVQGLFLCRNELWNAYTDMFYRRNYTWLERERTAGEILLCAFMAEDYVISRVDGSGSARLAEAFGSGVDFAYLSSHENRKNLIVPNGLGALSVYAEKVFANTQMYIANCNYSSATEPIRIPGSSFDFLSTVTRCENVTLLDLFTSVFAMEHLSPSTKFATTFCFDAGAI